MIKHLKQLCLTEDTTLLSAKEYPLTITASSDRYLNDYQIYGNSIQDGTPSIDAPIELLSVGTLVSEGEYAGKYNIPVTVTHGDIIRTTSIYLDAPLRKIGSYAVDYIDFKGKRVVRSIKEKIFNGSETLGRITNYDGENTIYCYYNDCYDRYTNGTYGSNKELCNILKRNNWHLQNKDTTDFEAFVFNSAESYKHWYYFRVNKARLTGTSASDVKEWLKKLYNSGTPMKIYYALEKAIEEPVNLPKILQFKGDCTYTVETEITPSSLQVKYH